MPDPLLGTTVGEAYRIESALARGGMGVVYRASHVRLGRAVAVKVLRSAHASESASERFRREALTLARLSHPNIVTVHDFGFDRLVGSFLVMELVDGPSLADEIGRRQRFDLEAAASIVGQIADALDAAHERGIVHRDIKPANVLLEDSANGTVAKVVDFGIAALLGPDVTRSHALTASGVILGTPLYLSPEQCNAEPVDARSDVYSLACLAFEMLTGQTPFTGSSLLAILNKHAADAPPRPTSIVPDLPPGIDDVLLKALSKSPDDRHASAGEFAGRINAAIRAAGAAVAETVDSDRPHSSSPAILPVCGNLPVMVTTFVGRDAEVAEIALEVPSSRLLTLAGIGGIGKTRLALEVAAVSGKRFRDGAWFVDLSPIQEGSDVVTTVAREFGLRDTPADSIELALVQELRPKRVLLVFDNCEQVIEAAADAVALILDNCPGVHILATSRETLGVAGETVRTISPLGLPFESASSPDELEQAAASKLFVDRVRLHNSAFAPVGPRAAAVARLCRKLDGIPLALELAAARTRVLSVEQIIERLDNRFNLLRSADRSTIPRQQTLRATIDWSYDLLNEDERRLFRRLAVFVGGWTLEAAESVCADELLAGKAVLDLLTRLVEKSLVVTEEHGGPMRFSMLETIRQYSLERLRESPEESIFRSRHARWFARFAADAEPGLRGRGGIDIVRELDRDIDNLRAAMRRGSSEGGDLEAAVTVATKLSRYWESTGRSREAAAWLARIAAVDRDLTVGQRADLARCIAWHARLRGDLQESAQWSRKAIDLSRTEGDRAGEGTSLISLATICQLLGDFDEAWRLGLEALSAVEHDGAQVARRGVYNQLGLMASDRCAFEEAEQWYEKCLERILLDGDDRFAMVTKANIAIARMYSGDAAGARACLHEAEQHFVKYPDVIFAGRLKLLRGAVLAAQREFESANLAFHEALRMGRDVEDPLTMINGLEHFAEVFLGTGRPDTCLTLISAAARARRDWRIALPPSFGRLVERMSAEARLSLGDEKADAAAAAGAAMRLVEAVEFALGVP